ncbi:hypothetical protein A2643_02095 [Candidatus Nomurabacteria bacterium RIFCSPHIGHO2_01_FULL_39_220]|uniref:Uncharacterized protein n=1 Tax=Candidatus Nomurabacteria bacterium RIFCSPLOWO2_02_FULL_40_67 TaxID=1801787 RepID=A0A1F6Y501_9BACT|nr:MAG: hypothetical protein UU01_C0010G0012 [Parcubacteria group bacterium GW2011_GWA2_40_37]KKS14227.1 MAG: hypothetical protein UU71_C0031G0012 [Parcubacteria group bacterium GW2011_GWB1_41_6]KKS72412.1 MAG: hypothetical protein UV43_C0017G0012 [Parcubacteria group bacterium GW2011_GWF2_42_7]OGI63143.1 MAG: hypothetical protein A2W12_04200 [Candidatus Nomurabacteria bacterium RBG_16_40_11]OGI69889.1 MAG: hypothetical protein A2643_02095 [Candidatus Nomurabacteria bacterium RIFCSPHIGHO2_01_FU
MNDEFLNLYNEFLAYADKGDESGARKFLVDNLTKFPQEVQDKLIFAFFEEALMDETKGMKEIAEIQKQGLAAMSQIDKAKRILEDKIKEKDLRDKLTQ